MSDWIFCFGFISIVIGIVCSKTLMSIGTIMLFLSLFIGGKNHSSKSFRFYFPAQDIKIFFEKLPFFLIIFLYFWLVLSLSYSTNIAYGLHDLKIKLPLIIIPLAIWVKRETLVKYFSSLLDIVLLGTVILDLYYLFWRSGVPFISHIRVTSWEVILVAWGFYSSFICEKGWISKRWKVIFSLLILIHLLVMGRGTLFFSLIFLSILLGIMWQAPKKFIRIKFFFSSLGFTILFLTISLYIFLHQITRQIPQKYIRNVNYEHYGGCHKENGYLVWDYIVWSEVKREWEKKSNKNFEEVRDFLFRYLSSKGLPKDSIGIANLSDEEIKAIEGGATNYIFSNLPKFFNNIYENLRGIYIFFCGHGMFQNSIYQRLYHIKVSLKILKETSLIGCGVGDVALTFNLFYDLEGIPSNSTLRLRAHNQFITFLITIGVGGVLFLIAVLVSFIQSQKSFLLLVFWGSLVIGCLIDDMLETQAGVALFSILYGIINLEVLHGGCG